MNLAAVWKAPLIVIVENNCYAYSTPTNRQMAVEHVADKAKGLGIHGETVDGNDPLPVYDAVREARSRGIAGEGPSLIEVLTYRRKGHAEHDMQKYVPEGEIEAWEKKDPVDLYEKNLIAGGYASRKDIDAVGEEVKKHLEEEIDAAMASPMPEPGIALEDVYAVPSRAEDVLAPYRDRE
jgi:pyruvate dehydrogenase E1 component alpha subunit/2-oxoisovalerate dehydrogenase E1 component alpha subunit